MHFAVQLQAARPLSSFTTLRTRYSILDTLHFLAGKRVRAALHMCPEAYLMLQT